MITVDVPSARTPRLLAIYAFRFDAHLVSAMLQNVEPLVDGWISYDDRGAVDDVMSDEVSRRLALLDAAREAGAEWVLAVDPDERFETRLRRIMPSLLDGDATAYSLAFREMYTPNKYRVDGLWGAKRQVRLIRIAEGIVTEQPHGVYHLPWSTFLQEPRVRRADANVYHLKMITAERRRARAALYTGIDPEHRMQPVGYDYLADDTGMQLERIPFGRGYRPRHVDDGGLWMSARAGRD